MATPDKAEIRAYALKLAGWLRELLGVEISPESFVDVFLFNAARVGVSNYEDLGSLVLLECKTVLAGGSKITERELRRLVNRIQHQLTRKSKREVSGIRFANDIPDKDVASKQLEKSEEEAELQKLLMGLDHINSKNLMLLYLLMEGEDHKTIPTLLSMSQSEFYNRRNEIKQALSGRRALSETRDANPSRPPPILESEPIRLMEVVASEVGRLRNDAAVGGALYRVPIRLSRRPSAAWVHRFVQVWNNPPSFSTMHRPGIASIVGDRIVLNGTTLEDVEQYHKDTLNVVVDKVNRAVDQSVTSIVPDFARPATMRPEHQIFDDAVRSQNLGQRLADDAPERQGSFLHDTTTWALRQIGAFRSSPECIKVFPPLLSM